MPHFPRSRSSQTPPLQREPFVVPMTCQRTDGPECGSPRRADLVMVVNTHRNVPEQRFCHFTAKGYISAPHLIGMQPTTASTFYSKKKKRVLRTRPGRALPPLRGS